jgi:hypothetical protein
MPNIAQGLIDFAFSPPVGVLNTHLDGNGPYGPGNHTLTQWLNSGVLSNVSDTFGLYVNFNGAIPPKLGLTIGYSDGALVVLDEYQDRLVQLVVQHQLISGAWVPTQVADLNALPTFVRWAEALPGRVGLYIAPGIHIDLFYLLVA